MTRFARPLLLSLLAAGLAGPVVGGIAPAAAADRETVAVLVAPPPAQSETKSGGEAVLTTKASASTLAASTSRAAVRHREPTLNHQRPLNDDLARFTRAF